MKCREALNDFKINLMVIENKAQKTIEAYIRDLNCYLSYLETIGIENMEDITILKVDSFFQSYSKSHAPSSCNRMLASIRSFHKYTTLNHPKIQNPVLYFHGFQNQKHLPVYLQIEDVFRLIHSFDASDQGIFHKTIIETLYSCGLRVSELCSLRCNEVHLQEKILKIKGKGGKERMVPIACDCIDQMNLYLSVVRCQWDQKKSPYFFINQLSHPLTRQYVHELIKKKVNELQLNPQISAHSFRHSFATHLLNGNVDLRVVQELLGHSDIQTTQIYTHIQDARLKNVYDSYFPSIEKETKK